MRKRDIYLSERAQGLTYREIAEKYGVSHQGVYASVNYYSRKKEKIRRWKRLSLWLEENRMTESQLARLIDCSISTLTGWRTGRNDPSMYHINKLLEVTGLPYEELFAE